MFRSKSKVTKLLRKYCKENKYDKVLKSLNQGANVNAQSKNGLTPLHHACSSSEGNMDIIQLLIERDANVNLKDNHGSTALQHACSNVKTSINAVKILLERGCDANDKNDNGTTALHLACSSIDDIHMVKLLITRGADVDAMDNAGLTALLCACANIDNVRIVELLIDQGASVNTCHAHYYGLTPLLAACAHFNNVQMIKLLIDRGANVNVRAKRGGLTALHYACYGEKIEMVKILIRRGADATITDDDHVTALDMLMMRAPWKVAVVEEEISRTICSFFFKLLENDRRGVNSKIAALIPEMQDIHQVEIFYIYLCLADKSGYITTQDRKNYTQQMFTRMTVQISSIEDENNPSIDIYKVLLERALKDKMIDNVVTYMPNALSEEDKAVRGRYMDAVFASINV
eukprot:CAMPEP_0197240346 /NCGR_PEP_ID=MMETSP1429-20130617/6650_1 /TAXON_ID=49237 /ORGANISM="Chaetoceros  sp., Strain UNC1202" /LENGTH=402 /DNA_ID=CAMNT_0042699967 /DNA_START=338 /DNA_END=1546 /DNA_ORIENTATION=+